jgi:hypothetical protein
MNYERGIRIQGNNIGKKIQIQTPDLKKAMEQEKAVAVQQAEAQRAGLTSGAIYSSTDFTMDGIVSITNDNVKLETKLCKKEIKVK